MEFVNREKELERLEETYSSGSAELVVIYGRRRIGKSELARKSIEGEEDTVYYQATETTPNTQLEEFVEAVKPQFPEVEKLDRDWEVILEHLAEEGAVVVIDEFPYLIESDSSIPSRFQRVWDSRLKDSDMTLVLIGSSISIMEEKVLSGGSPLHGRRTTSIDLQPLNMAEATEFYPNYSAEEKIKTWSVLGGTPHYLQNIDPQKSFEENLNSLILSQDGILHDEPEFLLRTELEKPNRYFSLLKAMARGNTSRNDIAQGAGIDPSLVGSYLNRLEKLRIIDREVPVTEDPTRSRKGHYRIREPLFDFWFRFIYGREDRISLTDNPYEELVKPEINSHVSPYFEQLCQRALPDILPRTYRAVGRWWFREHEIDVVGIAESCLVLGECKFSKNETGAEELYKLEDKKDEVRVPEDIKENTEYAIFSLKGFAEELKRLEKKRGDLHLFKAESVLQSLSSE